MPLLLGDNIVSKYPLKKWFNHRSMTPGSGISPAALAVWAREPAVGGGSTNGVGTKPLCGAGRTGPGLSPGKHRLLELVHPVVATFQTQPAQLQQHRAGGCMDEVVSQWDLHDRP